MRAVAALVLILAIGGCTTPGGDVVVVDHCDVEVVFGSYAMGVDAPLKARILAVLDGNRDVVWFDETPWGREGESQLCLHTSGAAATNRTYDAIVDLIPRFSDRAPTRVVHIDGRSHGSTLPPPGAR